MPIDTAKVSIVLPVYNEENNLEIIYEQIKRAFNQSNIDYEMIFVDDGSTDGSLNVMKRLNGRDKNVSYISLSRNFGQQNALFAGLSYASADAVITMDADLQHPPSLIPKMIDLWRKGAEVVYTTKEETDLAFGWRLTMKVFYWLFSKISGLKLNFGQSDFRLLDKKVVQVILKIPEYHKFLRGQVEWVGFRQQGLSYKVRMRHSGKSKFPYINRFPTALDGIFGFSKNPLHLIALFSSFVACGSFLYMIYSCLVWIGYKLNIFTNVYLVPGWTTIVVGIFFFASIQLLAIAILGEYVSRTYDQTKGRPVFIIREASGGEEE